MSRCYPSKHKPDVLIAIFCEYDSPHTGKTKPPEHQSVKVTGRLNSYPALSYTFPARLFNSQHPRISFVCLLYRDRQAMFKYHISVRQLQGCPPYITAEIGGAPGQVAINIS